MDTRHRNIVTELGSGDRTMVMAHGFDCDQTVWQPMAAAFSTAEQLQRSDALARKFCEMDPSFARRSAEVTFLSDSRRPREPAPSHAPRAAGPALRVLYVEDNPVNAIVMESLCEMQPGVLLHIAHSGAAALAWLRHHRADLLLLDMGMPDMDGLQLLLRMRALGANGAAEAIIVSADARPDVVEQARLAGADGYWTKPLDADVTLEHLRQRLCASMPGEACIVA